MEKNKIANIHFVTYSNGKNRITGNEYSYTQNLLVNSIQLHTKYNVIYHTYNLETIKNKDWFSKISKFPNVKFNSNFSRDGYYNAWKVFLVKEIYELMGDDDILYYVDSSGYYQSGFTSNIDTLLEFGFENHRICGTFGFDVKNNSFGCCDNTDIWKHIYNNLELNYDELIDKPHILNSWFVFKKEKTNENFINEWAKYITTEINDIPLIAFHHTVDQSIFNILVYKYNLNCFFSKQHHDTNKNHNNVHDILNNEIKNENNINKFFINPLIYTIMNLETFRNHAFSRSIELSKHIRNITNGKIYAGPFKDTYISGRFLWGDGDVSSKLLGLYEQQLFPYIETVINDAPDLILNIGCAEGYYGVGFAKRLPNSKIVMIDVNEAFNSIIDESVTNNNLTNVEVVFNSSHNTINQIINQYKKSFIFMDCEGAELHLLDKNYVEGLKYASIIVETHDFSNNTITETLKNRFSNTHNVEIISSGCKDMNIDIIKNLSDVDKMLLWNEWRPCEMQWLYLTPKLDLL